MPKKWVSVFNRDREKKKGPLKIGGNKNQVCFNATEKKVAGWDVKSGTGPSVLLEGELSPKGGDVALWP